MSGSTGVIRGIEYCCVLIFIRCILDERFHLSSHRYDPELSKHIDENQNQKIRKNGRTVALIDSASRNVFLKIFENFKGLF